MNEEERKERFDEISEYYEIGTLDIPRQAKKAHKMDKRKVVAGQIRYGKGNLVEKIAEKLLTLACGDLGISKDRYHLTCGPINVGITNTSYIMRKNILNPDDYIHSLELDNILMVDGKPVINVESKAYAEATMLKTVMSNISMVYQYYPDMGFVLLQLENALGGDYANDVVKKGSGPAHVIMSQHPEVDLQILTLLDGNRSADRPIHEPKYYKPMNMAKLGKAYFTIKRLISERVQGDQVFSQKKVYVYNYSVFDKVVRRKFVGE